MAAKKIIPICLLLWLSFGITSLAEPTPTAATRILTRKITIDAQHQPLGKVLRLIEEKAYFRFSYNSTIIDEKKNVSLTLINQPVSQALDLLFKDTIRYKEAGNHLILLKNDVVTEEKTKSKTTFYFTGKITDAKSGKPIAGASIYDVD